MAAWDEMSREEKGRLVLSLLTSRGMTVAHLEFALGYNGRGYAVDRGQIARVLARLEKAGLVYHDIRGGATYPRKWFLVTREEE